MNQLGYMCHFIPLMLVIPIFLSHLRNLNSLRNSSPEAATYIESNPSLDNSAHPNSITGPEPPKKTKRDFRIN